MMNDATALQGGSGDTVDVKISELTHSDSARWDQFVHGHPDATFFHQAGWRNVIEKSFGHRCYFLKLERGGQICGVLPLVHVRSLLFGNLLSSTPFCVYGGVLASDEQARRELTEHACLLARKLGVDYLELRNRTRQNPEWPSKDLYVTFRKPIDADNEKNLLAIPRKQRAMVRKGIQKNLTGLLDTGVERLYAIYSESLRNLGTPVFSKQYLRNLMDEFGSSCEIRLVLSQDVAVAGVLNFFFRDEVLPYYGGSIAAARSVAANDFMYWDVMSAASARGLKLFDFGRSKRETGSFDFKKNWGFEPQQLCYEYFLVKTRTLPDLSPKNPKYEVMINVWRRLPVAMANILGPSIAKNLG